MLARRGRPNFQESHAFIGLAAVRSMTWLSNTKLLIALQSNAAGKRGRYIFDISASGAFSGYDPGSGCPAESNGPVQSGFKSLTNVPYGTAYTS